MTVSDVLPSPKLKHTTSGPRPTCANRLRPAPPATRPPGSPSTATLPIAVLSSDKLTRVGALSLLARHPRITVLDDDQHHQAKVVLLVVERLDTVQLHRLETFRSGAPDSYAVIITDSMNDADLLPALDGGVLAVLTFAEAAERPLGAVVHSVGQGRGHLSPRLQGALAAHLRRIRREVLDPNGLTLSGLTSRECDVLRLVAEGLDTEQIASQLCFSERSVKYVLTHLMTRFDLHSRAHAVAFAVRLGAI